MNYMKKMVRISYHGGFNEPMECAGMNNPNDDPSHLRVPKEPHDERNIFYNSTNALWSLYESESESSDKVRIKTLKEDMDMIFIFVLTHHLPSVVSWVLLHSRIRPVYSRLSSLRSLSPRSRT